MLAWIAPEGGFRKALSLLGLDRAGFKGWPLAIAGPAAIHLVGLACSVNRRPCRLCGTADHRIGGLCNFQNIHGLAVGTLFALGEEIGWRGYMLPRLLGRGVVPAMLLVGFLHGVWHLPLMLTTDYYHNTRKSAARRAAVSGDTHPCRRVLRFPQAVDRKRLARGHRPCGGQHGLGNHDRNDPDQIRRSCSNTWAAKAA